VSVEEHGSFEREDLLEGLEVLELLVDLGVLERDFVQFVQLEYLHS
jgi:hypothetical protein